MNLSAATDGQVLTLSVAGVTAVGGPPETYSLSIGVLAGDVDQSGSVNVADISYVKLNSGFTVTSSNFLDDVTGDDAINVADVSSVKLRSGDTLASGGTNSDTVEALSLATAQVQTASLSSATIQPQLAVAPAIQETSQDAVGPASAPPVPLALALPVADGADGAPTGASSATFDTGAAPSIVSSHSTAAVTSNDGPANGGVDAAPPTMNAKSTATPSPTVNEPVRDRLFVAADFRFDYFMGRHKKSAATAASDFWTADSLG